jgi:hypothetical protein
VADLVNDDTLSGAVKLIDGPKRPDPKLEEPTETTTQQLLSHRRCPFANSDSFALTLLAT